MSDYKHDHGHGFTHTHSLKREGNRSALTWAFGITAFIMVAEALGEWLTNSLDTDVGCRPYAD